MKKILTLSLIAGSMLFANSTLNNNTVKQKFLNEQETIKLLKDIPNGEKLINLEKEHKIKIYIDKSNKDYYIVFVKDNRRHGQFFISKDKKYLILGDIIDLKTKKPLRTHPPVNKNIVKEGIAFTYGKGDKDLYVITDPECPFCKRLMQNKDIMNKLEKNYKIHVIIYPLSFHKNSMAMTEYIMSAKTDDMKHKRLLAIFNGSTSWKNFKMNNKEKAIIDKKIEKMKKAAQELNFRGTPDFFDKDFNEVDLQQLIN